VRYRAKAQAEAEQCSEGSRGRMGSGEVMACHVARAAKIVPFLHSTEGKGDVVVDEFTGVRGQRRLKVSLEST
jgi:hypothetical protein